MLTLRKFQEIDMKNFLTRSTFLLSGFLLTGSSVFAQNESAPYGEAFSLRFRANKTFDGKHVREVKQNKNIFTEESLPYLNEYSIITVESDITSSSMTNTNAYFYCDYENDYGYIYVNDPIAPTREQCLKIFLESYTTPISKVFIEVDVTEIPDDGEHKIGVGPSTTIDDKTCWQDVEITDGYTYLEYNYGLASDQIYISQSKGVRFMLKSITVVPEGAEWTPPTGGKEQLSLKMPDSYADGYRAELMKDSDIIFSLPQPSDKDLVLSFDEFDFEISPKYGGRPEIIASSDPSEFKLSGNMEEGIYNVTATLKESSSYSGQCDFILEIYPSNKQMTFSGKSVAEDEVLSLPSSIARKVDVDGLNDGVIMYYKTGDSRLDISTQEENWERREIKPDDSFKEYDILDGIDLSTGDTLSYILGKNGAYSDVHTLKYRINLLTGIEDIEEICKGGTLYYDLQGRRITDPQNLKPGFYVKKDINGSRVIIK